MGKYSNDLIKNEKWIQEGRGKGRLNEYKPWLTVRDVPSMGRSSRVFGKKSQRIHHLLSDLELAVFLMFEWSDRVLEIREQFPLNLKYTQQLAESMGINHPAIRGIDQYMSSDFLVNSIDEKQPVFAIQVKPQSALNDKRTIEKLQLERTYWLKKEIPWKIITENEIPKIVIQNINWLYPLVGENSEESMVFLSGKVKEYAYYFSIFPDLNIIDFCKKLDKEQKLSKGETLGVIRILLAKKYIDFDIFKEIHQLQIVQLFITNYTSINEEYCV